MMTKEERCRLALGYHRQHYNCGQSVLGAFRDLTGLTEEQCWGLGSGLGSGMRCGGICGAVSGGVLSTVNFLKNLLVGAIVSVYFMATKERCTAHARKLTYSLFSRDQVYTTLELRMKCGVGKCGRCNIGTKYVCKDGPVFRCDEIDELPNEY